MKNKHNAEEVQAFVESLYLKSEKALKELFKHQYKGKKQFEEELVPFEQEMKTLLEGWARHSVCAGRADYRYHRHARSDVVLHLSGRRQRRRS